MKKSPRSATPDIYPYEYETTLDCPKCSRHSEFPRRWHGERLSPGVPVKVTVKVFTPDKLSYRGECGHTWIPFKAGSDIRWLSNDRKWRAVA